jgi:hypothetical protein
MVSAFNSALVWLESRGFGAWYWLQKLGGQPLPLAGFGKAGK